MTYIVVTYSCSFTFFLFWFLLGLLAALSVMIYIAAYTGFFSSQWVSSERFLLLGGFFLGVPLISRTVPQNPLVSLPVLFLELLL